MFETSSRLIRFLNYILDIIGLLIFSALIGFLIYLIFGDAAILNNNLIQRLINSLVMVVYFLLFEGFFQRTPGKFITRTKVVSFSGDKPAFKNIVGRSFARLIPFEAFSFVGNKFPIGWHDSLSKTLVVPSKYSKDDVEKINKEQKSTSWWVIILAMLAIIIIGIVATFSVIALGNARVKSRDFKRVSDIRQIVAGLELYYNDSGNYPTQVIPGQSLTYKGTEYLKVPTNPTPVDDGDCPSDSNYTYKPSSDLKSYTIDYCLGSSTDDLSSGKHKATANSLNN